MLYDEFISGTGCKVNDHNYKVYKNLEILYMNSDMTKAEIYEYGKKLVDNSKTPEELKFETELKAQIEAHKAQITYYKTKLNSDMESLKTYKEWGDDWSTQYYKGQVNWWKQQIKVEREVIRRLKQVHA